MISCFLNGGLGNMLFQIATTYAIAKDNNDDCIFDFEYHSNMPRQQSRPANIYKNNIFKRLKQGVSENKKSFQEKDFFYQNIDYQPNLYLKGYFQTEKYFKHRRKEILDLFDVEFKEECDLSEYTSMHIRRGDYLKIANHPVLNVEYYQKAIELSNAKKIVIFSDDIAWCQSIFKGSNFLFMDDDDYKELYFMSLCKNNIIANSSFSWWGAWLNKNEDKQVYAPKQWFSPSLKHDTKDLYCDGWFII